MTDDQTTEQRNDLQADIKWFHMFKAMIHNGNAAQLGPHAAFLYVVIKSYTNFSTGDAFPRIELLAEKSGMSIIQVKRGINTLEKFGYIVKEKQGRRNNYRVREKVDIKDNSGRPVAVATWDYLPSTVEAVRTELRNFLMQGHNGEPIQAIHIDHLNLTIQGLQIGSHNTQINLDDIHDPGLRKEFFELMKKMQKIN